MKLDIKHCSVQQQQQSILDDITATFDSAVNKIVGIVGPSGAGKTTLLRCMAGLQLYTGSIQLDGQALEHVPPAQRQFGLVDQHDSLFPQLTVFDNIAYPLRLRKINRALVQRQVQTMLADYELKQLSERLPQQLSGGEKQRVALARSLIYEPKVLLLDEPFRSLDNALRFHLLQWLQQVLAKRDCLTILVTHDLTEARLLTTAGITLRDGRIDRFSIG